MECFFNLTHCSSVTIAPTSRYLRVWKLIVYGIVIVICFHFTFQLCCTDPKTLAPTSMLTEIVWTYIFHIFYILDIVVNLRTGITTPHGKSHIVSCRPCAGPFIAVNVPVITEAKGNALFGTTTNYHIASS